MGLDPESEPEEGNPMSVLRKLTIAALVCGAAVAAPSAALAAVTQPAPVQHAALPGPIHKARCTPRTFHVYYGASKKVCYAGYGGLVLHVRDVHEITTGDNRGYFVTRVDAGPAHHFFLPKEAFGFPQRNTELTYLAIEPLLVPLPA
jgi:hypothetical protein